MTIREAEEWIDDNHRTPLRAAGGQWIWFCESAHNRTDSVHVLPKAVYDRLCDRRAKSQAGWTYPCRDSAIRDAVSAVAKSDPAPIVR